MADAELVLEPKDNVNRNPAGSLEEVPLEYGGQQSDNLAVSPSPAPRRRERGGGELSSEGQGTSLGPYREQTPLESRGPPPRSHHGSWRHSNRETC